MEGLVVYGGSRGSLSVLACLARTVDNVCRCESERG